MPFDKEKLNACLSACGFTNHKAKPARNYFSCDGKKSRALTIDKHFYIYQTSCVIPSVAGEREIPAIGVDVMLNSGPIQINTCASYEAAVKCVLEAMSNRRIAKVLADHFKTQLPDEETAIDKTEAQRMAEIADALGIDNPDVVHKAMDSDPDTELTRMPRITYNEKDQF
jgi:hypothetical protein